MDILLVPQSGTTADNNITKSSDETIAQNVKFNDADSGYTYQIVSQEDPTRTIRDSDDADLSNFFSRPIKIFDENWQVGTSVNNSFDPWDAYFTNPRVENRITNYNLLRATLHVKVIINGNGFYYGRAILAYLPLNDRDDFSDLLSRPQDVVQASQCPHIFINPTTSEGGELILPFMYHFDQVKIPDRSWTQLGNLTLRTINPLQHANDTVGAVNISMFAWAEDVSLSVLTSQDILSLDPQAGTMTKTASKNKNGNANMAGKQKTSSKTPKAQPKPKEEPGKESEEANNSGMISGPATFVAKVATALTVVPQLAPFAMATSKVAGTVASVARIFGYSRPPVTKNPDPLRPTPISQLATTTTPDTALKLTVDDKQELTIDPRIAGIGPADPLNIRDIATRESYLTTFDWAVADASESLLFNMRLDPVIWAESTPNNAFHFPACAMAALPFKYWTGSMRVRFQVVASSFHKGRLKIVYDPNYLASNEYNTNYIQIIDITDESDFTIEIGNGQDLTLLEHHRPGLDSVTQLYSTTAYTSQEQGNGVLGVYVVNELTTPNQTVSNDVQVNVYVSMGDDFEVFVPDDAFTNFVLAPQSGIAPQPGITPDAIETTELDAPQQSMAMSLGPGEQDTCMLNAVYTGESILSFRPLLKRYSLWRKYLLTTGTTTSVRTLAITQTAFPFLRGNVPGAVDTTGALATYTYCNTLLLHWVVMAFQGYRGSMRYKIIAREGTRPDAGGHTGYTTVERVNLNPVTDTMYSYSDVVKAAFTNQNDTARAALVGPELKGAKGMAYTNFSVNPNLEMEVPFYSRVRFMPGKRGAYTTASVDPDTPGFKLYTEQMASSRCTLDFYSAVGEDFQVYMFTGLPRMYYEASPPAA